MYFYHTAALAGLLSLVCTQNIDPRQPRQPLGGGSERLTFNNTVSSPAFTPNSTTISWVSAEEDGVGVVLDDDGNLSLEDFVNGNASILIPADQMPSDYWEYWVRSDLQKVMFATNV